jgi:hypothetical protein
MAKVMTATRALRRDIVLRARRVLGVRDSDDYRNGLGS